jgi:hypothetical protein
VNLPFATPLLLALAACTPAPHGATGTWNARVATSRGQPQDIVLNLNATGRALSGAISGGPFQAQPIENGKAQGDSFSFQVHLARPDGSSAAFTFAGAVSGGRMSGTIAGQKHGQMATFTATRGAESGAPRPESGPSPMRHAMRAGADTLPPQPQGADPTPQDAQRAVLTAFDNHDVVGLGILSYANQDFDQFILDLIRNPAFADQVNDIEVECGNALYQPVLDRYIAGDSVPLAAARQAWRNTTQPFCGVTTFYDQLFPLVRRVNQSLPTHRRLRVLAGDPPVDWSRRTSRRDVIPPDRDSSIAAVMAKEVLAKHRKALMVFGSLHLQHGGGSAVGRIEAADRAAHIEVVIAHNGFGTGSPLARWNDTLEHRMTRWPVPSLVALRGTWIDDLPYGYFFPLEAARLSDVVDAYLYLGPGRLVLNDPIPAYAVLDTAYMAELQRRLRGGPMAPGRILREAARAQVFFNETLP